MRVLLLASTFPTHNSDEQVPWLSNLVRRLNNEKNFDLEVLAPSFKGLSSHRYHGIDIHRFRYAPRRLEVLTHEEGAIFKIRKKPWLMLFSIPYILFGTIALISLMRKRKYHLLHIHWPLPNGIIGLLGAKLFGVRTLLSFHGAEFTLMKKIPLGRKILAIIVNLADATQANSTFTCRQVENLTDKNVTVIPYAAAVRPDKISKTESGRSFSMGKRVLYVGRLIERKGVKYLIRAMEYIVPEINVNLSIVGEGELKSKLLREVKNKELESHIILEGRVAKEKLYDLYLNCDVFVLPAVSDKWGDTEGLGVVLLEAMSFGKPVVASRTGGIEDIVIDGKTGILVNPADPEALAKSILKILRNGDLGLEMGSSGRRIVKKKFSFESMVQKTIKMYKEIVQI